MALHHQVTSCKVVQETKNGKTSVHKCRSVVIPYTYACCGVTVRLLVFLPHFLAVWGQESSQIAFQGRG